MPASTGPVGMYLPLWVYLAVLPKTLAFHAERGIPEDVTWPSLSDAVLPVLRGFRKANGFGGLGLWGSGWNAPLRFRGADYRLGRLGFNRGALSLSNGACGYVLNVHIPGGTPLSYEECGEAFARAREFFPRHFPEEPVIFFTCESWLMDPQLAEYLPEGSNLVRFQRRFQLLPLTPEEERKPRGDQRDPAAGLRDAPSLRSALAHADGLVPVLTPSATAWS